MFRSMKIEIGNDHIYRSDKISLENFESFAGQLPLLVKVQHCTSLSFHPFGYPEL